MNKIQVTILSVISIVGLLAIGALVGGYLPKTEQEEKLDKLGSAVTLISGSTLVSDYPTIQNTNVTNLNADKWENGRESIVFGSLTATSTSATSTISWGLAAIQRLGIGSTATTTILGNTSTSTFSGGIRLSGSLDIDSTSATSTFANGLRLEAGSFQIDRLLSCSGASAINTDSSGNIRCGSVTISPAGSDTEIQFNDASALAGDSNFTWNKTTNALTVTGATASSSFSGGLSSGHFQATSLTSTGALSLFATGANSIFFQTNGGEKGVLTSGGNLGIGTTTPGLLLSIAGNALFGGSTGTTTIEHGINLATLGGAVRIATTSAVSNYKLLIDGAATIVQKRIASAASPTFNWSDSNYQIMALSQAGHSISFTGGQPGANLKLELCQDSTGNRTVTSWGANILFMTSDLSNSTSTPGLATKIGACNLFSFTVSMATGTQVYYGSLPLKTK